MDEEHVVKFVETYLKKKGFKQTDLAFQEEFLKKRNGETNFTSIDLRSDPDLSPFLLSLLQRDDSLGRYDEEYGKLRSWAYSSLDLYKHELLLVLYPVFIHCYMDLVAGGRLQEARAFFNKYREDHEMMHSRDLQKLEGDMEFAHSLRISKIKIKICQYSNELLMQYLRKTKSSTILGIVNEHISFQISPGQPSSISDDTDAVTLVGGSQDLASEINMKEIHWGLLEDMLEDRLEKAGGLLSDSEKNESEVKESDLEDGKKRALEGGKQGPSVKKSKKDKSGTATVKIARPETNAVPSAPRVKSELPLPLMSTEVELSIFEDLRNRVQLNSTSLPSVCFYTFMNTYNGINCSAISHDGSLLAGGFSDSSVKVWDMASLAQQSVNAGGEADSTPNGKKSYSSFHGHSGPIYSMSFSPHSDFILSSSADSTVRLWSTKLNANLVCYKGHNFPVWDVQFSPFGHYFASASHDRTARIWSIDRIQPLRIIAGHLSDVDCVQWHANCNYIATGSSDKSVRLWDVQSGECVRVFVGHRSMILSLAMSPDGRFMASGDEDGSIMIWDLSNGRCITPLLGHNSCVWSLCFSCEGSLLASGSDDCTVKLWDVNTSSVALRTDDKNANARLRLLKTLPTKSTSVHTLRFSRRNLLFAAGAILKNA